MKAISFITSTYVILCLTHGLIYAQVAINTDGSAPHSSAMLDVKSTSGGLLIPRMTTVQRALLSVTAAAGLIVYDTDLNRFFFYNGSSWLEGATGTIWLTDLNNIYQNDLNDSVGIGTINPQRKFEILGDSKLARLSSSTNSSFLEYSSTATYDWASGVLGNTYYLTSTSDNFNTSADEYIFAQTHFTPGIDLDKNLGTISKQWLSIYGGTGYFSDKVMVGSTLALGRLHLHDNDYQNCIAYLTPKATTSGDSSSLFLAEDHDASYGMFWMYDGIGNQLELWGKSLASYSGPHMVVDRSSGDIAFGDTFATGYKLSVKGKIICTELRVNLVADWPDYVFREDYELMPLKNLRAFIKENGHLPNVPSSETIRESGMDVGEMQQLMMEKIEELSLYVLQLEAEIDRLKTMIGEGNR